MATSSRCCQSSRNEFVFRILHLVGQLEAGGCELQLLELSRRLAQRGHQVQVCAFHGVGGGLSDRFKALGIEPMFLNKAAVGKLRFMTSLVAAVKSIRPDIVHTWLPSAYFWGAWAARLAGVRFIVASERSQVFRPSPVLSLSARLLGKRVVWTTNSIAGAASLARHYGVDQDRVQVIRNGVRLLLPDRDQARRSIRQTLGLGDDIPIVLMVASRSAAKNYPMFIRAASRVAAENSNAVFVGLGREVGDDGYLEFARRLGCQNLVMPGETREVARWYAGADVFCLTSFYEGSPNALLEAMFSGLPVVVTAFSSVDEIIDDGEDGFVVPIDDDQALADRVLSLLRNPSERSALGGAARKKMLRHYSWEQAVARVESLYRSALACPAS